MVDAQLRNGSLHSDFGKGLPQKEHAPPTLGYIGASISGGTIHSEDVETVSNATMCPAGIRRDVTTSALDETLPTVNLSGVANGVAAITGVEVGLDVDHRDESALTVDARGLRHLCAQQAARILELEQQLQWQSTATRSADESQLVQELRNACERCQQKQALSDARVEQLELTQAQLQAQNQELFAEMRSSSQSLASLQIAVDSLQKQRGGVTRMPSVASSSGQPVVTRMASVGSNFGEEMRRSPRQSLEKGTLSYAPVESMCTSRTLSPAPAPGPEPSVSHVSRVPLVDGSQWTTSAAASLAAATPLARAPNGSVMPSPMRVTATNGSFVSGGDSTARIYESSSQRLLTPVPSGLESSASSQRLLNSAPSGFDALRCSGSVVTGPEKQQFIAPGSPEIRHVSRSLLGAPPPQKSGAQQQSPRESMTGASIQTSAGCSVQSSAACSVFAPRTTSPLPMSRIGARQVHSAMPRQGPGSTRSTLSSRSSPHLSFASISQMVAQM